MDRRKRKGRQGCIIQCAPVYASSLTGVRALVLVYIHACIWRCAQNLCSNNNDLINPGLGIFSHLESIEL